MSLNPGTKLGPYEVITTIGAGGMGEVYKAKDTRLDRTVAIKVLPTHLADNPELKQRFEREARAVSSLNHPHICTLHDIGEQDGTDFLVMEYIEGETLADRLKKGALPLDQALRYGIEIADASGQSSSTRSGPSRSEARQHHADQVRGEAAGLRTRQASADVSAETPSLLSALPTEEKPLTREGSILGTFQYMAPEQLEGKDTDARTDIFAFGSVLYEMLTGRKAFEGTSQASLITAIMSSEPRPVSELQSMTPPVLDWVAKRCLEKDPDERWQSAKDLEAQLQVIIERGASVEATAHQRPKSRERLAWILVALLSLLGVVLAWAYFGRAPGDEVAVRFEVHPPNGTSWSSDLIGRIPMVSPDGRSLAFVADEALWVRPLDDIEARRLPGTEGVLSYFWSPDSQSIAFLGPAKLKAINITEGFPHSICDSAADAVRLGGTWGPDGTILFSPRNSGPIHRVAATGGAPEAVTVLDESRQEFRHMHPQFLPDGRHFLYFVRSVREEEHNGTYVGSLDALESGRKIHAGSRAIYAPPGYLLSVREETLWAQPFDAQRWEKTGSPIPIAAPVGSDLGHGNFSVSSERVLAYSTSPTRRSQLIWFDRQGQQMSVVPAPEGSQNPALSPDGTRLAVDCPDTNTGASDIWLIELSKGTFSRFTFEASDDRSPIWSPDGSQIAFASNQSILLKDADGVGKTRMILDSGMLGIWAWSPDGRNVLYGRLQDIWILPTLENRQPVRLLENDYFERGVQFSPDGRWISYTSNETGRHQIYVQSFPPSGGKWQISTNGGTKARWRKDSKELFYIAPDRTLMSVQLASDDKTFEHSAPEPLFETRAVGSGFTYAVSPNGERFLMNTEVGDSEPSPIVVVINWTGELQK